MGTTVVRWCNSISAQMEYPIVYKIIPTQYAFYIHKDGKLEVSQLTIPIKNMKFESSVEARKYVEGLKKIL